MTIAAVAAHKEIFPEKIDVQANWSFEPGRPSRTDFAIMIDLGAGLDRRARKILFNVARNCEVHKMLSGQFHAQFQLTDTQQEA